MSAWVHLYATIEFRSKPDILPQFVFEETYATLETFEWDQRCPSLIPTEYTLTIDVRYSDDPQIFMPFMFSLVHRYGAKISATIHAETGMDTIGQIYEIDMNMSEK